MSCIGFQSTCHVRVHSVSVQTQTLSLEPEVPYSMAFKPSVLYLQSCYLEHYAHGVFSLAQCVNRALRSGQSVSTTMFGVWYTAEQSILGLRRAYHNISSSPDLLKPPQSLYSIKCGKTIKNPLIVHSCIVNTWRYLDVPEFLRSFCFTPLTSSSESLSLF